jgi:23S rRNA (pseudouridine1915-N3)-methyltransferase
VRFRIVAVGKLRERGLREVADDYLDRIRKRIRCDECEVKGSAALLRAIPTDGFVVALDCAGISLSSRDLARRIPAWAQCSGGTIVFAIGAAEGLPKELLRRAEVTLSLSAMTLPHRLARVILLEQLYRALTIQRGEPYARED